MQVKEEELDPECLWLGSRPGKLYENCEKIQLIVDPWSKKRKRKPSTTKQGRPKTWRMEATESESEFELSDMDDLQTTTTRTATRQATRWVVYTEIDEKMLEHWMVQGRSLDYVSRAYRNMRSRNGLYQKMAGLRRKFKKEFDMEFDGDKGCHFDARLEGFVSRGPIPREDLLAFKLRLEEMRSQPQLQQRMSGEGI